jgi:hypothetical protein
LRGVCHVLEVSAIIGDVEVTLAEVVELGVEVKGTRLLVPEELLLEGEPDVESGGVTGHHGLR